MEEKLIDVYIKVDNKNIITQIDSSIFLSNSIGWIKIDEGKGDKYAHAQGNYFPIEKPLVNDKGVYNYKYIGNKIVELTDEEKEILFPKQEPKPTEQQILNAKLLQDNANMQIELEQQNQLNAQILLQIAGGVTND